MVIPWWWMEIDDTAKKHAINSLDTNLFTLGEKVSLVEQLISQELSVPFVTLTNSGTSALSIGLILAGVKPGDEVIVPALTWIATAQAVLSVGATPIVVDVNLDNKCLDPESFLRAISCKTRAVVPVFFNGRIPNMDEIQEISKEHGIRVIEDRCKALGTTFRTKSTSPLKNIACFSLGMISFWSVGYGGFICTTNESDHIRSKQIRDHGLIRIPEEYREPGGNFKISDILASLAIPQIPLISKRINHALSLDAIYQEILDEILELRVEDFSLKSMSVGTYTEVLLDNKIDTPNFVEQCKRKGVGVNPYHKVISTAPYLRTHEDSNARKLENRLIALPSGPGTSHEAATEAARRIREVFLK